MKADRANASYRGSELEVFAQALNWKNYVAAMVRPYLGKRLAEVGAGLGGTTQHLCSGVEESWLCIEPDENLAAQIDAKINAKILPQCCRLHQGSLADVADTTDIPDKGAFDTIIYMDVLEHIEDDRAELELAVSRLERGGHLVVLCPAHQFLYSPFDRAIGHYRRYDRGALLAVAPPGLEVIAARYLDSAGLLASMANRYLLHSSHPSQGAVNIWDRVLVPVSRVVDRLSGFCLGKSVLVVWRKA